MGGYKPSGESGTEWSKNKTKIWKIATGYLDSTLSWQGYCNPPALTSGRLPNGVNGKSSEVPIPKVGKGPCTPDPRAIGLESNDGWLVRYNFEGK